MHQLPHLIGPVLLLCIGLSRTATAQMFTEEYFRFIDFDFVTEMAHGDFDNDGLTDFIITGSNFAQLQLGLNTGDGVSEFTPITTERSVERLAVVDIDSDGDLDIIGRIQFSGVRAFLNDGLGNFETRELDVNYYNDLAFRDINGDGSLEMILAANRITIYEIAADSLLLTQIYDGESISGGYGAMAVIDYDGDGDIDIYGTTETGGIYLVEQTGPLDFSTSLIYADTYDSDHIVPVHFNDDDILDFVLHSDEDNRGKVVISTGDSLYMDESLTADGVRNELTLVGDLYGGDREEIITFEFTGPNDPAMYIKEYDAGLKNGLVVADHYASYGGDIVDLDNDGDLDFYFFQNDVRKPGLVFYYNETPTSATDIEKAPIAIYPNPSTRVLNVDIGDRRQINVSIFRTTGELVAHYSNRTQIPTTNLDNGAYIVQVLDMQSGKVTTETVVIKR